MLERQPLFPHVIELNHQARKRITCSVYLIYEDQNNWALVDIGYEDAVDEVLELIRQLDFPFSKCVTLIASHADVDHIQGLSKAKQILKTTISCHPSAAKKLEAGDRIATFALIDAQGIDLDMPKVSVENRVEEGDTIAIGDLQLEVWHT
ncbi:MAG: MBL fold metallo-hydrolase, partial [Aeoliella sp.]